MLALLWPRSPLALLAALAAGLGSLSPRHRYVVVRYYGLDGFAPDKFAAIGRHCGLSAEMARVNCHQAVKRLRQSLVLAA